METRSGKIKLLLAGLAAGCLLLTPAHAEENPGALRTDLGIQGGLFLPDDMVTGKDDTLRELEGIYGLRFGHIFGKRFGLFLDTTTADINTNGFGDVDTRAARVGFEVLSKPYWKNLQWFVAAGGGIIDADLDAGGEDFDRNFWSLSVGQRIRLEERANFRWQVRGDQILDDSDVLDGEDLTRIHLLVGVNWGLGRIRKDDDGDGVFNRNDDCPDTPKGAIVDERGCPKDSDGDGVWDGIDRCPDTPRGAIVDEWGCPKDSDGDGVYDGIDRCPNTPKGALVDEWGCPKDSDGDGVYDGIDRCPDTPRGAIVDEWGCPKDSDGDGVYDGLDKCPNTPRGVKVDKDGCPLAAPIFEDNRDTLILEGVYFEFDKAVLTPASADTLDRVAASLKAWPEVRVEIGGHTDWVGSDEYNLDLSDRRAASVRNYLIGKGVPASQMTSKGYGETRPIAPNESEDGRAQNRRVELKKLD